MPESTKTKVEKNRLLRRARTGTAAGMAALALALSAESRGSSEEPLPVQALPEFIMGAQEDSVLSVDLAKSTETAAVIKEAGFNTLKVTMPWTHPRQCAEIDNDLARFQNAVKAAKDHELAFMLNLIPGGGAGLGRAPITSSQRQCYIHTAISYMHAYEEITPSGHMMLEIPNEPNSPQFWRPQKNRDDEWIAPRQVARLFDYYELLHREADNLGIGLTVIGGGLASKGNALGFVEGMEGANMDVFSTHPYGEDNNEAPDVAHPDSKTIAFADLRQLRASVNEHIGQGLPIWYTEYGAKTRIPADKLHLYAMAPQEAKTLISEAVQAQFYVQAIEMAYQARSRGIGGLVLFNVIDDADGFWTSGLFYPDRSPKSSQQLISQAVGQAANATAP